MRILVTGSLGSIGQVLTEKLRIQRLQDGIFGLDIKHQAEEHSWSVTSPSYGRYFRCDVGDYRQLQRVFDLVKPDFVYHTAAEFGRWNGEDFYEQVWRTNAIGTKNVIKLAELYNSKVVIFSSSEVYGDSPELMSEPNYGWPQNDYAASKIVNEWQAQNAPNAANIKIVRLFNVYGPGEVYTPYRSVLCRMVHAALTNTQFTVFQGHYRSHLYIDDCVNALIKLLDWPEPKIYNIGSTNAVDITELAKMVGCKFEIREFKEPNTTVIKRVDNSLATAYLGLQETVSLEQGIINTKSWQQQFNLDIRNWLLPEDVWVVTDAAGNVKKAGTYPTSRIWSDCIWSESKNGHNV